MHLWHLPCYGLVLVRWIILILDGRRPMPKYTQLHDCTCFFVINILILTSSMYNDRCDNFARSFKVFVCWGGGGGQGVLSTLIDESVHDDVTTNEQCQHKI